MSSWETLLKRLKDQRGGVVRVDITCSRPWPKMVAGAADKARSKLVGAGITECFMEISDSCKNARTDTAQPFFVLTHEDGWQVMYHPKKKKEGLLAFRLRDDPHGDLRFDEAEPDKEDRTLAFELAAEGKVKSIAAKMRDFQKSRRPNGWKADDFEIGPNVWAWVLTKGLKDEFWTWLANPTKAVDSQEPPKPLRGSLEDHEIQLDLEGEEDGVQICKAITMQGEDLPVAEALDRIRMANIGQKASMAVKPEPPEEGFLKVKDLLYTQRSCREIFKGGPYRGRKLEECTAGLIAGKLDPTRTQWLTLDVVKDTQDGKLWSIDNRRLKCLKEYQKYLDQSGTDKTVMVKARIHQWTETHCRFLDHLDTWCHGKDIRVRNGKRPRPDWD